MTVPYLWMPDDSNRATAPVVREMECALRVHPAQKSWIWSVPGLGVGVLESHAGKADTCLDPARQGSRHYFWVFGEIFHGGKLVDLSSASASRRLEFRELLLDALLNKGFESITSVDGEFVLIHWDAKEKALVVATDRFGGLPLYWSQSPDGLAIAGGVRGVLMAPGVDPAPDEQSLREAVTFGGFRLGDRTNVESVRMLPGATILTCRGGSEARRRYWTFGDVPRRSEGPMDRLLEEAAELWEQAIRIRLDGCERPGQTLSGGLDSRAILAEAAPRAPTWTALTYGIPGCDDARLAKRAASAIDVRWRFYDLYRDPGDWLASRSKHIQSTDGLIELGDLMHVETIDAQSKLMDEHFSGYIGDVVCGPTYSQIERVEDLYVHLPYYGIGLGLAPQTAHQRLLELVDALDGAPVRFAIFENKFPQSTNLWTAAWRPWIRVRKPFLDYRLFDFWQALPVPMRRDQRLYEHLLYRRYPHLFKKLPHQKTGVPVLSSRWRHELVRGSRFAARKLRRAAGLSAPSRTYRDDRGHCSAEMRSRIEHTILRPDSISCAILGRTAVTDVLRSWFESGNAPDQVVGALYVFDAYHSELASHLRRAAAT